jgi:hypothetical protein
VTDHAARDLRGTSFRNQDLSGSDFTAADLRGADFSGARLVEADFTNARLGVRPMTGLLILAGALLISIAAGLAIGDLARLTRDRATSSDWTEILAGSLVVVVIVAFFAVLIMKGVRQGLGVFLVAFTVALVLDFTVVVMVVGEFRFREPFVLIVLFLLFGPAVVAGVLGRIVGGTFGSWAIAGVAVVGAVSAGRVEGGAAAIVVSALLILISKRALALDERDRLLRRLAHRIVTRRGTRFTGADLTGADFTATLIAHSDLSQATLDGVIWESGHGPATLGGKTS